MGAKVGSIACWLLALLACVASATPVVWPNTTIACQAKGGEHDAVSTAVVWLSGGALAAAGDDHAIRIFTSAGKLQHTLIGHRDWIRDLKRLPNGELASVGDDGQLRLWNSATGAALARRTIATAPLRAMALHPNGAQLATVGYRDQLRIINVNTTAEVESHSCPCRDMQTVCFAPDGARLAAAGRNGKLRVYDLTTNKPRDLAADARRIRTLAFAPSGELLATGGDGPEVKVWDLARGEAIATLPARPAKVFCLAFLDDHHLAIAGSDNAIRIWSISSQLETAVLKGHTGTVAALAYNVKTYQLASASFDTTVRIWNLAPDQTAALAPLVK